MIRKYWVDEARRVLTKVDPPDGVDREVTQVQALDATKARLGDLLTPWYAKCSPSA